MTQSPPDKKIDISLSLEKLIDVPRDDINDFFSRFDIDTELQAHSNLVRALERVLFSNSLCKIIFGRLKVVKGAKNFIHHCHACPDLPKASPCKKNGNPVCNYPKFPVAAFLLTPVHSGKDLYPKQLAYDVISALFIVIRLSGNRNHGDQAHKLIKKVAVYLRRSYQNKKIISELELLDFKLQELKSFYRLLTFIKSNAEEYKLFEWLSDLTKLIEIETDVGEELDNISLQAIQQLSLSNVDLSKKTYFSLSGINQDIDSDESNIIVSLSSVSNNLPSLDELNPSYEIDDHETSSFVSRNLKKDRKMLSEFFGGNPTRVRSRELMSYDTSIFNEIEREWLFKSLNDESPLSSLIIGLMILTGLTPKELGKKKIGEDGDISANGKYKRKVPSLRKAKIPNDSDRDLYKPFNEGDYQILTLNLPKFIQDLIVNVCFSGENIKIKALCKRNDMKVSELVKTHIKTLRDTYGSRFITKRISGQLKNYISASHNDPCINYTLFGKRAYQAPTALYYRSIREEDLQGIYANSWKEYFKCH